ncbi:unnamed protein product [Phytophthora fragariaefolia]|uniref:Unnamed protein product n=1 Tax=Phytophthora fragariaefolia TaxID=1490495 RepID=A0A9W6XHJ9_9STRA|nr:unnamed protein product [Phytophthora fragariaefolia]
MQSAPPSPKKPKVKDVKCRLFDGAEVFCKNACPKLAERVYAKADVSNPDRHAEADRARALLYQLRGDGRKLGTGKRAQFTSGRNDRNDRKPKRRGSHDQTPFSHRQEEVTEGNSAIVAKCYVCGDPKHKFTTCPFMIKAKQLASANAVTASDGDDSVATDNGIGDGADIWMAVAATLQENESAEWLLDSGATHPLCGNREHIAGLEPAYLPIRVANGAVIEATAKGSCVVTTSVNGIVKPILLTNVYFAEGLQRNLVSVKQLRKAGLTVIFGANCTIRDSNDNIVATAAEKRDLWCLSSPPMGSANFAKVRTSTLHIWHQRLGHVNYQDILRMVDKGLVWGITLGNRKAEFCMSCSEAKQTKRAQPSEDTSASSPTDEVGAVIGMDLKTDLTPDRLGHKHILTMIDYGSSFNKAQLLKTKGEAAEHIRLFITKFERHFNVRVKYIRTDGGGELSSRPFQRLLSIKVIIHQSSETDTSASNVIYASYIRNRHSTRANPDLQTPLECLTGKPPSVAHILKFGSNCTLHIANKKAKSLRKRAERAIVLEVSPVRKGYIHYLPRTKKITVSASIQNIEQLNVKQSATLIDDIDAATGQNPLVAVETVNEDHATSPCSSEVPDKSDGKTAKDTTDAEQLPDRLPTSPRHEDTLVVNWVSPPASFLEQFATLVRLFLTVGATAGSAFSIFAELDHVPEPSSLKQAMASRHWPQWKEAIAAELAAISKNSTWEIFDAPPNVNLITGKWVFKIKFTSLGELERFKARDCDFTRSRLDPGLYFRRHPSGKLTVLGLYVDDVLIVSQDPADTDRIMEQLKMKFNVKDLGVASKCLGFASNKMSAALSSTTNPTSTSSSKRPDLRIADQLAH